jgi:hypothetical protein
VATPVTSAWIATGPLRDRARRGGRQGGVDALGAPLLDAIDNGARIVGANGDQRAYNTGYHGGVSPADMYFARFDGFVFVPVSDDPLSGTLPAVDQLG